jgi:hypothetical protein
MREMKSFLQTAIIAILGLTIIGISTSAAAGRVRPHVTRNSNVMILEYDFDKPQVFTEGDFDSVTVRGLERYGKPGEPVIPVKAVHILVPAGMKIAEIRSVAIDSEQLPDTYRLSHGHKPRLKPSYGEKIEPFTPTDPNPEIFESTEFWPGENHELVTVQSNRGYNIAHVNLFPVQYSPKPGKIKTATTMRLKIRLTAADSSRRAKPTKHLRKRLERNIDNPDTIESYDTSLDLDEVALRKASPLDSLAGPYQYIVITDASLAGYSGVNSFQDLCNSKIARGILAGIVTTEWIYDQVEYDGVDNQTRIRNFLIDAYQTWGTEYALLGGNKDIIPVRYLYSDGTNIPADMYYGCVDPPECTFNDDGDTRYGESNDGVGGGDVDLTAEIAVARACVENSTDVANFVNKTLVYGSTDDPYLDYALSGGGWLGFGGIADYNKPFSELIRIGSDLYTGHYTCGFVEPEPPNTRNFSNMRDFNVSTLYDADGTCDATTDLVPILNGTDGNITPQIVYIADHGSTTWGMVKMSTTETSQPDCDTLLNLNNTRPFFFYDDSCDVGHFDSANCFSEVATTMEHGAFACITNSRSGWGGTAENPLDSPTTQLTREFYHSFLGEGTFELGRAHLEAKVRCIWRISYTRYDIYQSTLFGDPELQLRITNPCDFTCGDIDGSGGDVDMGDFAEMAICWGKNPQDDPNCLCSNLVEFDKHIIDLLDLAVLAEMFLSSSELYPPNNCSTSITDPYAPTPDPMSFATAPYATDGTSIEMVATKAKDISGVRYYFACTSGGGHDSGWQSSTSYKDTGLALGTEYTYTVKARDESINYNETAASAGASATTFAYENIVLPGNGGVLESFTSEYGSGWVVSDLTNGVTDEDGWCSEYNPEPDQEFVYSFRDGNSATLHEAVIHGGTAEGSYYSKDVEVWTSVNGSSFTFAGGDTLLAQSNDSVTIDLGDVAAKEIKLIVTSGYRSDYWELAEFVVYGNVIE